MAGWLWGFFFENNMESEFIVIQSMHQNELSFVFIVCDKILLIAKYFHRSPVSSKPVKNQC